MWIKKKEIEQLSEFVKGYSSGEELDIRENKEGSFNVLKNDIYALVNTKNEQIKAVEAERDSLSDYMADISHQLKTPITSMMIMADLLEEAEPETFLDTLLGFYAQNDIRIEKGNPERLKKFTEEKWAGSSIAKGYSSEIVFVKSGAETESTVSMNNPASFAGWTFYQMSYGRDGSSVLGAVKNPARLLPWLAVGMAFFGMIVVFLPRAFGRDGNERR